jgi:hypothetical protein
MQAKIEERKHRPDWLNGPAEMLKLDVQVAKETRESLIKNERDTQLQAERERLAKLVQKEQSK